MAYLRRVFRAFWGYFDLATRVAELEGTVERLEARMREHELEWTNDLDKLTKLYQRQVARARAAADAIEQETPSPTDARLSRLARKQAILNRRTNGL